MSRFKKLYETLLENSELYVMFDGMQGDWELDKEEFILAQKNLEKMASEIQHLDAYNLLETEEEDFDE